MLHLNRINLPKEKTRSQFHFSFEITNFHTKNNKTFHTNTDYTKHPRPKLHNNSVIFHNYSPKKYSENNSKTYFGNLMVNNYVIYHGLKILILCILGNGFIEIYNMVEQ